MSSLYGYFPKGYKPNEPKKNILIIRLYVKNYSEIMVQ